MSLGCGLARPCVQCTPRSERLLLRARRKVAPVARPAPTRLPKRLADTDGLSIEEYMQIDGDDGDLAEVGPDHRSGHDTWLCAVELPAICPGIATVILLRRATADNEQNHCRVCGDYWASQCRKE